MKLLPELIVKHSPPRLAHELTKLAAIHVIKLKFFGKLGLARANDDETWILLFLNEPEHLTEDTSIVAAACARAQSFFL